MTPHQVQIQAYFDLASSGYNGFWHRLLRLHESLKVREILPSASGLRALEIACGAGFYTEIIARQNPRELHVVDSSAQMIASMDPTLAKHLTSVSTSPFELYISETKFDRLYCFGGLEFFEHTKSFFEKAAALAESSAKLCVLFPVQKPSSRLYRLFHKRNAVPIHLFDSSELIKVAERYGWLLQENRLALPFSSVCTFARQT